MNTGFIILLIITGIITTHYEFLAMAAIFYWLYADTHKQKRKRKKAHRQRFYIKHDEPYL